MENTSTTTSTTSTTSTTTKPAAPAKCPECGKTLGPFPFGDYCSKYCWKEMYGEWDSD